MEAQPLPRPQPIKPQPGVSGGGGYTPGINVPGMPYVATPTKSDYGNGNGGEPKTKKSFTTPTEYGSAVLGGVSSDISKAASYITPSPSKSITTPTSYGKSVASGVSSDIGSAVSSISSSIGGLLGGLF